MKYGTVKTHNGEEITISKIILGTVSFGSTMSVEKSFEVMDTYFAHGGRTLDTARVYSDWLPNGHGASERTVGAWMKERGLRDEVVLITKGAHPPFENIHCSRMTPENILSDFEESLKTLQTDYIDIYYLHRDDETVPVNVIMDTLDTLVKAGKVKMLGASNWRIERILEANAYAKENGKTPFMVSEIQWSYVECTPLETFKDDTLVCMNEQQYKLYKENKIPVMAFSSQGLGVFSCGYKADLSDLAEKHKQFYSEENVARYQALLKKCDETGCTPSKVVLDHVTENQDIDGYAIVGCSRIEQLLESLATVE